MLAVTSTTPPPDTSIDHVRVEQGSSATVTCTLQSYSGSQLTKLEVLAATHGADTRNRTLTLTPGSTIREVMLVLDSVDKRWSTTCIAVVNGRQFSSTSHISVNGEGIIDVDVSSALLS